MPYFNIVAETSKSTVVTEYEPVKTRADSYQSEAALEKEFIRLESLRYFYDEPMCTLEQVMSKVQMAENQQLQAGCQMQGI